MDGQDYLNQISATNRNNKPKSIGPFSSKFLIIGAVAAAAILIITIILGALLSGTKKDDKTLSMALKLRLDNTATLVQDYQSSVKSSALRSDAASLYSILSDSSKKLTEYITLEYEVKENQIEKSLDQKTVDDLITSKDTLNNELFQAKINGILDRIFAQKMAYEISIITAEEDRLAGSAKNDTLKDILTTSKESLSNLYSKFNDFSETK